MSSERKRQEVIALVNSKVLKQSEAAASLGISCRQVKRLCRTMREQGAIGLISKRRGQIAKNSITCSIKQQVIVLAQNKYMGFGPTFMAEKLKELDGSHNVPAKRGAYRL